MSTGVRGICVCVKGAEKAEKAKKSREDTDTENDRRGGGGEGTRKENVHTVIKDLRVTKFKENQMECR